MIDSRHFAPHASATPTRRRRWGRVCLRMGVASTAACLAIFFLFQYVGAGSGAAFAHAPLQTPGLPLGSHCIGVGPGGMVLGDLDDPTFCGCTYGHVWYMGRPVEGVAVTLTFGTSAQMGLTRLFSDTDPLPFYSLSAKTLGAQRNDIITLTVTYAGERIVRSVRAWPQNLGEQQVDLVIPAGGVWQKLDTDSDYTLLAATDETFWAAGPAQMVRGTREGGPLQTLPTPPVGAMRALAVAADGALWAGGTGGLAHLDGATWLTATLPITGAVRAIAAERAPGGAPSALWVGGGEGGAGFLLSNRSGAWAKQPLPPLAGAVLALAVDDDNTLWAAFFGRGVAAWDGAAWHAWTPAQGLFSNYVTALAVDDATAQIWAGGVPDRDGSLGAFAGGAWRTFGVGAGLPAHPLIEGASAEVTALTHEAGGALWVGTAQGLYLEDGDSFIAAGPDTTAGADRTVVHALAALPNGILMAAHSGLWLFDRIAVRDAPTVGAPAGPTIVLPTQQLTLTATAAPGSLGDPLVAWEWKANADPLCTTASQCVMPAYVLKSGPTVISVRVQNVLGQWSAWADHALAVRYLGLLPIVATPDEHP